MVVYVCSCFLCDVIFLFTICQQLKFRLTLYFHDFPLHYCPKKSQIVTKPHHESSADLYRLTQNAHWSHCSKTTFHSLVNINLIIPFFFPWPVPNQTLAFLNSSRHVLFLETKGQPSSADFFSFLNKNKLVFSLVVVNIAIRLKNFPPNNP